MDAQLVVGAASDTVQVVASLEGLNRANAPKSAKSSIPNKCKSCRSAGRNWAELALLANGRNQLQRRVATQRALQLVTRWTMRNITLDGIDATGVQEQTMKADYRRLAVAIDAISEFRVTTAVPTYRRKAAPPAARRLTSSPRLVPTTCTAADFMLCATPRSIPVRRSTAPRCNMPPFTLEPIRREPGPDLIVKNKLFFFTNFEGLDQHLGHTLQNTVPDAAFRACASPWAASMPAMAPLIDPYPTGGILHRQHHEQSGDSSEKRFDSRRLRPGALGLPHHRQRLDVSSLQHRQRLRRYARGCSGDALRGARNSAEPCRAVSEADFANLDQRS